MGLRRAALEGLLGAGLVPPPCPKVEGHRRGAGLGGDCPARTSDEPRRPRELMRMRLWFVRHDIVSLVSSLHSSHSSLFIVRLIPLGPPLRPSLRTEDKCSQRDSRQSGKMSTCTCTASRVSVIDASGVHNKHAFHRRAVRSASRDASLSPCPTGKLPFFFTPPCASSCCSLY